MLCFSYLLRTCQFLISLSYLTLPTVVEIQNSLCHMCVTRMHVKDAGKHTCHLRHPVVVMGGIRFQLHTRIFRSHTDTPSELVHTGQEKNG